MLTAIRKHLKSKKAQSTAEYALLIGLVIGAAVVMQLYVKRGINAKMKDATDVMTRQTGDPTGDGHMMATTDQYEPYYSSREQEQATAVDRTEKRVQNSGEATTGVHKVVTNEYVAQNRDVTANANALP